MGRKSILCTFAILVGYVLLVSQFKPHSWYNTVFVFCIGMVFSYKADASRKWLCNRSIKKIILEIAAFGGTYIVAYLLSDMDAALGLYVVSYNLAASIFMVLLLHVISTLSLREGVLTWLGKHAFSIYIFQRLPLNMMMHSGNKMPWYITCIVGFAITLVISCAFDVLMKRLDAVVLKLGRMSD